MAVNVSAAMSTIAPHFRSCNLCEAICGIEITVEQTPSSSPQTLESHHTTNGHTPRLSIRGDKDDPFSRGYICPKAVALQDFHFDPDRLRYPVRRRREDGEKGRRGDGVGTHHLGGSV